MLQRVVPNTDLNLQYLGRGGILYDGVLHLSVDEVLTLKELELIQDWKHEVITCKAYQQFVHVPKENNI